MPTTRPPGLPSLPLRQDVLLSNTLFEELDDGFSEDFLREHTGVYDLEGVEFLDLKVDAVGAGQRVECLGEMLPNLRQLRLSQSHICTVRDLGTSLQNLRVLWLCRCSLQELSGICVLPVLEELYVSFNDITDLSPLVTHDTLQVLDLEGNLVEDFAEVRSLEGVTTLRELNLSLNPVSKQEGVSREMILEVLPQLQVLDDLPRNRAQLVESDLVVTAEDEDDFIALVSTKEDRQHSALNFSDDEDDDCAGVADLLKQVALETSLAGSVQLVETGLEENESSLALRELRRRACTQEREESCSFGGVATDEDPPLTARPSVGVPAVSSPPFSFSAGGEALSGAVAAFRAAICEPPAEGQAEEKAALGNEPSEQDLIVESLKRAERPANSLWSARTGTSRGTARSSRLPEALGKRPPTSFVPPRRECRTAWGKAPSMGSASTAYTSSAANTSRSILTARGADAPDSELTAGDDGAALAGNPLAAIRRRRNRAFERGEDEEDIRSLLKRFEAGVDQQEAPQAFGDVPISRPGTSDVRISQRRPLTGVGASPATPWTLPPRRQQSRGGTGADGLASPGKMPTPKKQGSAEVLILS
eukprot:TRINITY_DN23587_c0_g1_i1.p1 TRINITY_DN23587_c0_g1~~TRINITY_DN23587_c0_g1_i1.p1  ORF type:complete len:591 (-),score=101.49 TRINITY_DN23587_c0_g1_i1:319-2091(-)